MTKPKLFLIFHGRFPSEKAAALFAAKSAASFADLGLSVTLLVPRRLGRSPQSAFTFYGLPENFKVTYLPVLDLFRFPFLKHLAFYASFLSFSLFSIIYFLPARMAGIFRSGGFSISKNDIIYSNESLPILLASFFFPKTVYEIHDFPPDTFLYRTLFRRVSAFVATNNWKKEKIRKLFNVSADKILVERNAVSPEDFSPDMTKEEARRALGFPLQGRLVCYAGALRTMGMEKGIGLALESLRELPSDTKLLLVGGNSDDIAFYHRRAEELVVSERVIFTGFVPHKDVPHYLAAADVLTAPFPKTDHYEFYMSPMKIFEYMAAGRAIVASDMESIREITGVDAALLVRPNDPHALAEGIKDLLLNPAKSVSLATRARTLVAEHTWQKRALRISDFLRKMVY